MAAGGRIRRGVNPVHRVANPCGVCECHPSDGLVRHGRFVARVRLRFGDGDILVWTDVVDTYSEAVAHSIRIVPGGSKT